jgi:glutamine---fructose-6-phosphate transaminase (isomerizing)
MCGIVGYIGKRDAQPIVIQGLQRLEYRGYDSAGVAMYEDGTLRVTRAKGKLSSLIAELDSTPRTITASAGIGHTRWATHGKPSKENAHPHSAGTISLIHNGIVENYVELRQELAASGSTFSSETDTEVAAHLIQHARSQGKDTRQAFKEACARLEGSFAIIALDSDCPDKIFVAKTATPIVIGVGEGENFIASDIPALLDHTRQVIILEDGDVAEISQSEIIIENNGERVERPVQTITWDPVTAQKGGFKHFMLKEIHDQPIAISDTLTGKFAANHGEIVFPEIHLTPEDIRSVQRIVLVGCGTAWHACLMAKFFIEEFARIPCDVDYASEFRYRAPILNDKTLVVAISQSGETADTVAACNVAIKDAHTLAICNVLGSTLTRKVGSTIYTHAGPEISVASTKAFSTQLSAAYLLALYLGQVRGLLSKEQIREYSSHLVQVPAAIDEVLKKDPEVERIARATYRARDFLFLGRGSCYPMALEGALKLKEISYIHAEGYPSGEIKHGPIALIDENMPVVVLLQDHDVLFEKALSNLREVESRGARIIAVTDRKDAKVLSDFAESVIEVPTISPLLTPLIMNIPLQLLAYYVAVHNGTDVDLPRNLAKSVTVE